MKAASRAAGESTCFKGSTISWTASSTSSPWSFRNDQGEEVELAVHEIVEPLKQVDSPAAREAAFMVGVTDGYPFKVTLQAASIFLHPFTTVTGAYESVKHFADD